MKKDEITGWVRKGFGAKADWNITRTASQYACFKAVINVKGVLVWVWLYRTKRNAERGIVRLAKKAMTRRLFTFLPIHEYRKSCVLHAVKVATGKPDRVIVSHFLRYGYVPHMPVFHTQAEAVLREMGFCHEAVPKEKFWRKRYYTKDGEFVDDATGEVPGKIFSNWFFESIANVCRKLNKGRYIVSGWHHSFNIIDGQVIDRSGQIDPDNPDMMAKRHVDFAWRVYPKRQHPSLL